MDTRTVWTQNIKVKPPLLPHPGSNHGHPARNNNNNNNNNNQRHQSVMPKGQILHCKLQETRLHFCPKASLLPQTQEPRLQFYQGWTGEVASRCFLHPTLSIWTDLKTSEKIPGAPTRRWLDWIWLTGSSRRHRNSPQGLNISCIRVFDQIRDPEIPITLRSLSIYNEYKCL